MLVKQILTFSRQSDEEHKPIILSAIIKEVLNLLRASIPTTIEIVQNIRIIVGVNKFVNKKEKIQIPILEMDPQGLRRQEKRLKQLRSERDSGRVGQTLDRLRIACEGTDNTMPYILDAVRAYATLGEIIDIMKETFGLYQEPNTI